MSYSALAQLPVSEKNVLAWLSPSQRIATFEQVDANTWRKKTNYYVQAVRVDGALLTEASSQSVSSGEFFFNASSSYVYFRLSDDSSPVGKYVALQYRLFFCTKHAYLSHNLNGGNVVDYDGRLSSVSSFGRELDEEQTGVVLESRGSMSLNNADGYFDDIFDKLRWENAPVQIYSHFPETPESDAKKIFEGVVTDKTFTRSRVSFKIRDNVAELKNLLDLSTYSDADGVLQDSVIGKPKRVLLGRLSGVKCVTLDAIKDGYAGTGTISTAEDSKTVTGSGTLFKDELRQDDEIRFTIGSEEYSHRIESITSNTSLTLSSDADITSSAQSFIVEPSRGRSDKNRTWNVCGHKASSPSTTITSVIHASRFSVADASEFRAGEFVLINSQLKEIRRISDNNIVLNTTLSSAPSVGATMQRAPVYEVFYAGKKLVYLRDWSFTNNSSGLNLTFTSGMEANITAPIKLTGTLTFSNGSSVVTGSGTDFKKEIKPGDAIRSDSTTLTTYYHVESIQDETNLTLTSAFSGSGSGDGLVKRIPYLEDDSVVVCGCYGKEDSSGAYARNASDCVKVMLEDNGLSFNQASFDDAAVDSQHEMSLKLPLRLLDNMPTVRDAINLVNQSVFGSLTYEAGEFKYSILTSEIPEDIETVKNDDIIGDISVRTKADTFEKVVARYQHNDATKTSKESGSLFVENTSEDIDGLGVTQKEKTIDLYLYDEAAATTLCQRWSFFHEVASSFIELTSNLYFANKELNQKVIIDFERLYRRYGATDAIRACFIQKISTNGEKTRVTLNDMASWVTRVAKITPNTAADFTNASNSVKLTGGYILDNSSLTPGGDDEELGTNLIG